MARFTIESVFKAVDKVTAPVAKMQNRIKRMTRSIRNAVEQLDNSVSRLVSSLGKIGKAAIAAGAIGIGAVTTATTLFLREFSKIEDAEAAFTPLLGGAKKAKELVEALNKTAATTPFQFENLADTANQLLPVMNGNIENTIKTLRMLGDTSGGNAQKLESITRGFTKAMLKGKVDLESLNMIGEAGVPIFQELAKVMGKKVNASFFKMISAGKVTTKQLTAAFEQMTSKGGIFFGGMEISSKTLSGVWSTLKDNISLTAAEIGSVLAPTVKDLLNNSIGIAQRVREWVKANRELISKKFLSFVEAVKNGITRLSDGIQELNSKRNIIDSLIEGFKILGDTISFMGKYGSTIAIVTGAIIGLSLAMKAFLVVMAAVNVLMSLTPFGLLIIGIALLVSGFITLMTYLDDVESYFDGLGETARNILAPIRLLIDALQFVKKIGRNILAKFGIEVENNNPQVQPQVASPQQRISKSIQENNNNSNATVTIKDETGKAKVTNGTLGNNIKLQPSGGF